MFLIVDFSLAMYWRLVCFRFGLSDLFNYAVDCVLRCCLLNVWCIRLIAVLVLIVGELDTGCLMWIVY